MPRPVTGLTGPGTGRVRTSLHLSQERHNYSQAFEEDKTRFPVRLEKKLAFTSLKKYVTLYSMLQILPQVNILKECQVKGEALPPCTN